MTQEKRMELINRQSRMCAVCGQIMERPQFAHFIADTKTNRRKFGSLVIDSPLNGVMVCSLRCNDSCNRGMRHNEAIDIAIKALQGEKR